MGAAPLLPSLLGHGHTALLHSRWLNTRLKWKPSYQQSIRVSDDKTYADRNLRTYEGQDLRLEMVRHTVWCYSLDVFYFLRKTAPQKGMTICLRKVNYTRRRAVPLVRDAKENREKNIGRANSWGREAHARLAPRISRDHFFLTVYLRSRSRD